MQFIQEILIHVLEKQPLEVTFPALQPGALERIVESVCYQTLLQIQEIVHDESLSDTECFQRIEEIVCAYEAIGSSGGNRHDF